MSVHCAWSTRVRSESIRTKNWRREEASADDRVREEWRESDEEGEKVWSFLILVGFTKKTTLSA